MQTISNRQVKQGAAIGKVQSCGKRRRRKDDLCGRLMKKGEALKGPGEVVSGYRPVNLGS